MDVMVCRGAEVGKAVWGVPVRAGRIRVVVGDGMLKVVFPQADRIKLAPTPKNMNILVNLIPVKTPRATGWISGLLFAGLLP